MTLAFSVLRNFQRAAKKKEQLTVGATYKQVALATSTCEL